MKKFITLISLLCCGAWAWAQPIQLQIEIFPPYPVSLEYYINNADNAFVSITNTTGTEREIYFHTRISGNTGLLAQTKAGYRPSMPFSVPAFGAVFLTGNDLENTDFGFNSLSDVDISGATREQRDQIVFNRALPEGTYEICILAFDWATGTQIGFNCSAPFDILYGDMPVIILPAHEDVVDANDNSFLFVFWEPPFTYAPLPGAFEYRLKMIDITGQPFNDLEILMNDPGQFPLLDEPGIIDQVFNYQYPDQIELIEGHQYALRVQAIDPMGQTPVTNNGYSEITTFWYGFRPGDDDGVPDPGATASNCDDNCEFREIANQTPVASIAAFSSLQIGYFSIELQGVSNESGNNAAGTGTIVIPFMDSIKVNVEFSGVKVNANGRIYEGNVYAVKDYDYNPNDPESVSSLDQFLRTERLISTLLGGRGRALNLPAGIVWDLDGEHLMLGFNNMTFTPQQANCQVMYNTHYPSWGDFWLSLSASDICLLPSGFGQEFILHPVVDIELPGIGDTKYILKGTSAVSAEAVRTSSTYVEVDCKGIKDFGLNIEVQFSRDVLVPDTDDGTPGADRVLGNITVSYPRTADAPSLGNGGTGAELGFLGRLNINPFQVRGLPGIGFTLNEGWADFSDTRNPPAMTLPANYEDDNVLTQNGVRSLAPLWEGFYMKSLSVRSAQGWLFDGIRFQFEVADMILDNLLTAKIRVSNLADGDIGNWYLSLDTMFLELVQWSVNNTGTWNAGLNGRIGMPITGENQFLQYSAFILPQDEGRMPNMEFLVSPPDGLSFPFMQSASATLCPNSYVRVVQENGQTYFDSQLAGNMGVTFTEPVTVSIPWVDFQFGYHSQNGFSNQAFSILGQQVTGGGASCDNIPPPPPLSGGTAGAGGTPTGGNGSPLPPPPGATSTPVAVNNFPMSIEQLNIIQQDLNNVNFRVDPRVEVGGGGQNGFGAELDLAVRSRMNSTSKKLAFDGINLGRLSIDVEEVFGLSINGEIEFYQETNDRGARGELYVNLPLGISTELKADFGVRAVNFNQPFGTSDKYFGYWYVDGMVGFPGVPIAPGVHLHGLGGGVYVNMRRQDGFDNSHPNTQAGVNNVLAQVPNVELTVATTPESLRPVVAYGQYGLKLATRLAAPVSSALNMDVSIAGSFGQGIGINSLRVDGDAYLMCPLNQRGKGNNFWASAGFGWEKTGSGHRFSGGIDLFANVAGGVLRGAGSDNSVINASFLADTDGPWYFHAGKPSNRAGLLIDLVISSLQANGYFMVGHGLDATLPIPDKVNNLIGRSNSKDGNRLDNENRVNGAMRRSEDASHYEEARGIAFGLEAEVGFELRAWALYARLQAFLGFDINLTQLNGATCYVPSLGTIAPGINDWYATGQVYAGFEGAMGLKGRFLGKDYEFELFGMGAAMIVSAGGPNPTWAEGRAGVYYSVLNGVLKGHANFDLSVGNKCTPTSEDGFIPVVYRITPEDGDKDVSIFDYRKMMATFYVPVNTDITIPHNEFGKTVEKTVKIYISQLSVKDNANNITYGINDIEQSWSQDKKAVTFNTKVVFNQLASHTLKMTLKADEKKNGAYIPYRTGFLGTGPVWPGESHQHTFTTGAAPYPIPDEEILNTIPIRRQRNFMQEEMNVLHQNIAPVITFRGDMKPMAGGAYFPASDDKNRYTYYLRWQDLDGGEPVEQIKPLGNASSVIFVTSRIPELLDNTIYSCQLIRKTERLFTFTGPDGQTITLPQSQVSVQNILSLSITERSQFAAQGLSATDTLTADIQLDPGQYAAPGEDIIYQFYFKTSRYGTLAEKMAGVTTSYENLSTGLTQIPKVIFNMTENFDEFDVLGYYDPETGNRLIAPRVQIGANIEKNLKYYQPNHPAIIYTQDAYASGGGLFDMQVIQLTGQTSYNNYLNHSLIGFINLYAELAATTHNVDAVRTSGTRPTPKRYNNQVLPPMNSTISRNYQNDVVEFNYGHQEMEGYDGPLTDGMIQSAWANTQNNFGWSGSGRAYGGILPRIQTGASSFAVTYRMPYWVFLDIEAAMVTGNHVLSIERTEGSIYIPSDGPFGGGTANPGGPEGNLPGTSQPQILDAGGGRGGPNAPGFQWAQPAGPNNNWTGDLTFYNIWNGYLATYYPAFHIQLDNMGSNYKRMQQHPGAYRMFIYPDKGWLANPAIPGERSTISFQYNLAIQGAQSSSGAGSTSGWSSSLFSGPAISIVR